MPTCQTLHIDPATAHLSLFDGEAHLIIEPCAEPNLTAKEQIDAVERAFQSVKSTCPGYSTVFIRYFLSDAANQAALLPQHSECAVSVVEQPPLSGVKVAMWAYMAKDTEVKHLGDGYYAADRGPYRHIWKAAMAEPDLSSETATTALLTDYATHLEEQGATLADNCLRTWFFVHDVDINYKGMVRGRNDVFRRQGLTAQTHFIASTGIGGKHPDPSVMVTLDAYAVIGIKPEQITYLNAPDNLNPTIEYGVAFERATAVDYGDRRQVLISGTASIDNKGEVVHPGNIAAQTRRMAENVEALLHAGSCAWKDAQVAIVYLRDMADYRTVRSILEPILGATPAVYVLAPVCRHAWLVEMECIAIAPAATTYPRW